MEKVLIIGCARSGYWVTKLLNKKGYDVTITDAKKIEYKDELVKLGVDVYDNGHPELLKEIKWDFIVKNPGIPYTNNFVDYFVKKNVKIYTEIEIALRYGSYGIGAITGTNGKTTITTLLNEILKSLYHTYLLLLKLLNLYLCF